MLKRFTCFLCVLFVICTLTVSASAENPIILTAFTPDPAPVVFGDRLYLYCGEDSIVDNGFYNMPCWHCYSTTDMVNWYDHGVIMNSEDFEWAEAGSAWACQCIERNGKYYLYVTVTTEGGRAIGVAVADSPTGPFKDAIGKPLCGPNWLYIDPTVMIDDDGQAYLYFGNPNAYYCKLNEDMISVDGEVKQQNMTHEAFGGMTQAADAPSSYTEGPWIYKRNDLYYLVYASNGVPEGISYSTSSSPEGPWEFRGQIMQPGNSTTIHPGIIDYKGRSYFFYHGVLHPEGGWNKRSTAIAEFTYNDDGTIPLITHTVRGVEQLENFDPYGRQEAETMSQSSGVRSVTSDKRIYIGEISNGDFIKISGADLEDGAKGLLANLYYSGSKGQLTLHLDSEYGKTIGSIELDGHKTGFSDYTAALTQNDGVHDLYFVFTGDGECRFDYWELSKTGEFKTSVNITAIIIAAVAVLAVAVIVLIVVLKKKKSAK